MSLLLEALKQAALEKRKRRDEADDAPASVNPTSPSADSSPTAEPESPAGDASTSDIMKGVNDFLLGQAEKRNGEPEGNRTAPETARDTADDDAPETIQDIADDDAPDPASGATDSEVADDTPDPESSATDSEYEIEVPLTDDETIELGEDELDWDAFEASASEDPDDIELDLEDSSAAHGPVPEPIRVEELEETPAEQPSSKANPGRVEQLLVLGGGIEKRQRRRQNFLYFMLVLTAIGGVVAYYFFLLGNRTPRPIVQQVDAIADHEELHIPDRLIAPRPSTLPTEATSESAGERPAAEDAVTGGDAEITASADAPLTERTSIPGSPPPRILNRGDDPPSKNEILAILAESAATTQPTMVFTRAERRRVPETQSILDGYRAYQRGDYASAASLYRSALELAPRNRDARLGAAATAAAQSRYGDAFEHYQRLLAFSPRDADARIGLLSLMQHRGALGEVADELDGLLERYPDNAQLFFIKGMGFAANERWSQAQRAFFEAHSRDRENADFAFNLAVALDHLGQKREAQKFYGEAVLLAERDGGRFDVAQARARAAQLSVSP